MYFANLKCGSVFNIIHLCGEEWGVLEGCFRVGVGTLAVAVSV